MLTVDELLNQIATLPLRLAVQEHGADADHVEDDVAAAIIELSVAANLARAAQEGLQTQVDIARSHGATWRAIGEAMGVSPWRARRGKWKTRPLDSWW